MDETATAPLSGLESTFADALPELCLVWEAAQVPDPQAVAVNDELAAQLGLDANQLRSTDGVAMLVGNLVPPGATPVAMGYAGHQFGNYSPRLGDGRALLLGELIDPQGARWDVHLKGSGRTPFSRGGDGKATIGPMLREYLVSEAMHALGVPTTRSLAVITTGERIMREGPEPGAVLARVAAGHLRVGTFEYAARLQGDDLLRRLADYAIARHYPHLVDTDRPYLKLLTTVIEAQAALVAQWMLVGFIHGVMNTDNTTISGEGIDYGPCAFMDAYDPATVFSSIDRQGRYAYGNQSAIIGWNLARFAETLVPLLVDEVGGDTDAAVADATTELQLIADRVSLHWTAGMAAKLGLTQRPADDPALFDDLLTAMNADAADWTGTFRRLSEGLVAELPTSDSATSDSATSDSATSDVQRLDQCDVLPAVGDAIAAWLPRWRTALAAEGCKPADVASRMDAVNPLHIPRNHLVAEALDAATDGDIAPYNELLAAVRRPFDTDGVDPTYERPAGAGFAARFRTFCGT